MIPELEELEPYFERHEIDELVKWRKLLHSVPDATQRHELGRELVMKFWPDELERIAKTHFIINKDAKLVQLRPNYAQQRFHEDVIQLCRKEGKPIRGIILKARQLGFSTFIQCWQYMQCDENPRRNAMTVSYDDASTEELFQKSRHVKAHQWFPQKKGRDRKNTLEFANGSVFYTRTAGNTSAGRSQTIHHVHRSEIPMWPFPEETLLSLDQSVPATPESSVFDESTARGAVGPFYEAWQDAEDGRSDFIPFFAPWFWDPEYQMPFQTDAQRNQFGRSLAPEDRALQGRHGLSLEQMHWRAWTIRNKCQGSLRKFQQEYPSTPTEAFLTTGSPVFNPERVLELERGCVPPMFIGEILLAKEGS